MFNHTNVMTLSIFAAENLLDSDTVDNRNQVKAQSASLLSLPSLSKAALELGEAMVLACIKTMTPSCRKRLLLSIHEAYATMPSWNSKSSNSSFEALEV